METKECCTFAAGLRARAYSACVEKGKKESNLYLATTNNKITLKVKNKMKGNLLNKVWLRVMMIVAVMTSAFAGTAFADTHTLTWGPGTNTSTTTYFTATSGSNGIISFTTDKNSSTTAPYYNGSNLLLSYASNKDGASITLIPVDIRITGFVMTATETKYTPNVEYSIDGGTPISASANEKTYTVSDISVSSSLKLQNVATSTQLRIKTIQITYETNPGVETTITIDDSGLTNTDIHAGSAAGSLSATVKDESNSIVSTPAVVWSGNNDAVATIDANTGAVTLHDGGTVTFTASYAGVWGVYGPSHATYQMTVSDSTPQTELWVEAAIDDLTSSDVFVIVGESNNKTFALPHNAGDSANPSVMEVTVFDGKIKSNVLNSLQWTLSGDNTNGFTFYPNGSTTTWLYCNTTQGGTSNNNNLRVGTGSRNKFVLNSNNHLVTKDTPYRYFSVGTSYWFSYTDESNGSSIKFYKKVDPVTVNITIGYSTLYYGDRNLLVPADVEAFTYKVTNKLEVSKTYSAGDVIPAGTAVVLKADNGNYTFNLASSADADAADPNNLLRGTDRAATTTGGEFYYALSRKNGVVGLYWLTTGGGAFENGAHKAYLPLPHNFAWYAENAPSGVKGYIELPDEEDPTGIENLNVDVNLNDNDAIYNLAGQRMNKMQKGINIINGKKILK